MQAARGRGAAAVAAAVRGALRASTRTRTTRPFPPATSPGPPGFLYLDFVFFPQPRGRGCDNEGFVRTVMTARFRLPAGRTYNVRASELARDRQHTEVVCNILLLDNTVQAFRVNKHDQGQVLLDIVFKHLDLTERDYFGLQLADDSTDNPRWLDPNKPIRKQLKRGSPYNLNFRVKFFVSDPNKLQEEYTSFIRCSV